MKQIFVGIVVLSMSFMVCSCAGTKQSDDRLTEDIKVMMNQIHASPEYENLKNKDTKHSVVVIYTVPNDQVVDSPGNRTYARMARVSKDVSTPSTPPYPYPYLEQYLVTYGNTNKSIISIKKEY